MNSFIEHFFAVSRQYPSAIALAEGDVLVSYRELADQVQNFARVLRNQNVQREALVALMLEATTRSIALVLAVWAAGGGYFGLSPLQPVARITALLSISQPTLLVTEGGLPTELAELGIPTLTLDELVGLVGQLDTETIETLQFPTGDDLAYVLATSGSTGEPKAVELVHRGLLPLARAQAEGFAIDESTRVLQFSSLSFDASLAEIIATLSVGARLEIADGREPLLQILQRVDVATLPPSLWMAIDPTTIPTLRTVVTAGEPCPTELASRYVGRKVVNAYGPTEATVCATLGELSPDSPIHVGLPLPHVHIEIVDADGQQIVDGSVGEVEIAGLGVARGYRGDPHLTAEKFVTRPWGVAFRSGDLGRIRPDGTLELFGRCDRQLKVRGFRVEPAEVETALRRHIDVEDALVVGFGEGDLCQLVGYVIAERPMEPVEFQPHLAHLPGHMFPAAIVTLASFPRLVSGKVDLRSLPTPDPYKD